MNRGGQLAATRYFKATDGRVTVFRSSSTQVYRSANFRSEILTHGWAPVGMIEFSLVRQNGRYPVVEIDAAEFETLQGAKRARIERLVGRLGDPRHAASPQQSWIPNADLQVLA